MPADPLALHALEALADKAQGECSCGTYRQDFDPQCEVCDARDAFYAALSPEVVKAWARKTLALEAALNAACVMVDGRAHFRSGNDIPMQIEPRRELVIRAALAGTDAPTEKEG